MRRASHAIFCLLLTLLIACMMPANALAAAQGSAVAATTIPATMVAGTNYTVTITVTNTGTETWTNAKGYTLKAVGGSDPFTGTTSVALGTTDAIKTNQTKVFQITMKAPTVAGTYTTDWRMYKGSTAFGAALTKSVTVIALKSIAVTTPAKKLTYYVGDKFDLTGLVVTGTYSNGSKKILPVTAANVTGFNSTRPVTGQVLTISIGGIKTTYKVNVVAVALSSIAITTPASKLNYFVGEPLNLSGLVVTGTYNNGTKKTLAVSTANVAGFSSATPATGKMLTITVDGKTVTYQINVVAVVLNSIAITTPATKLNYFVGEPLNLSGLVVTGTYNNGTKKTLAVSTANVTGFSSTAPATGKTLTITVDGKTAKYKINVAAVVLNSIAITSPASKLNYFVGEPLSLTGLVVTGTYNNGTTKAMSITAANVTGFSSATPATGKTLTITVDGKTATYQINVVAVVLNSIAITTPAAKLNYFVGEPLSLTGLVVTGTYNNGTTKAMSITAANVTGFSSAVPTTGKTLTIAVDGKTATYQINVVAVVLNSIAITTPATKLNYFVGEPLSLAGLVVTGTYNNGTTKAMSITAANVTGFSSAVPTTGKTLTIAVDGKTATYQINVVAVVLNSIAITTPAAKLNYFVGELLDLSGLVVTGTYNNGTKKPVAITTANITGFDSSKPVAGQTLTITCDGKTATYKVNILAIEVSSITVTGNSTVVNGQTLQLGAEVEPATATKKEVTWSVVSGPATIDADGLLMATGLGTVRVRAVAKDGSEVEGIRDIEVVHALYNLPSEPNTLDSTRYATVDEANVINAVFEGLTRITGDLVPGPGVANSWDISSDGKTYTFHLRGDAKWSDGQAVTANDFYFAWSRLLDPEGNAPFVYPLFCLKNAERYHKGLCGLAEVGMKVLDTSTFQVTLDALTPYFLDLCAMPALAPVRADIVNAHPDTWATVLETYVGNGPFKLTVWDHGSTMRFVKNPNYWDAEDVALDEMTWSLNGDAETYMKAWNDGNIDIIESPPASEIPGLLEDGKLTIVPSLGTYYLSMNTDKAPFDNKDFRKALALAINRETLTGSVLQGGQIPAGAMVPPGIKESPTQDFNVPGKYYNTAGDIAAAMNCLQDSGMTADDIKIDYLYNAAGQNGMIAQKIKEAWEENLGIHVNAVGKDWGSYNNDISSGSFGVAKSGWLADYPDPLTFLDMFVTGNPMNTAKFSNSAYDDLIAAARVESNPETRMQKLHQAQDILMDEMPVIPIYHYSSTMCVNPYIRGFYKAPTGLAFFDAARLSKPNEVSSITVTGSSTMVNGQTLQLGVDVEPASAANKNVTWSIVSGPATIDADGLLRATGLGTVHVKAVAKDGSRVQGTKDIEVVHALYNLAGEPDMLDPTRCVTLGEVNVINSVFEGLMRMTGDRIPGPGVAFAWTLADDSIGYTFYLRDDAKWSDGQAVTANDFYYAWSRLLDPDVDVPFANPLFCLRNAESYHKGECTLEEVGMEVVDAHTFHVTLAAPTPYFLELCTTAALAPERADIVKAHPNTWATDLETYIGNGPFILKAWDHGSTMRFVKNPNYWNADTVHLDEMIWSLIGDAEKYMNAWNAGNIDIIESPPASDIPGLIDEGKLTAVPSLGTYYLTLNTDKAPFNNKEFRKALALAINRDTLTGSVLQGGQIPAGAMVPPGIRETATTTDFNVPGHYYNTAGDVTAAQNHLQASGLTADNIAINYLYNTAGQHSLIAQKIKEAWEQVLGIHVKLVGKDWELYNDDINTGTFDVAKSGWMADYSDPLSFLDMFVTDNPMNLSKFSEATYDTLIADAKVEVNPATRMQMLHDAEDILMEQMPIIPVYFYTNTLCVSPDIAGFFKTPTGIVYFDAAGYR